MFNQFYNEKRKSSMYQDDPNMSMYSQADQNALMGSQANPETNAQGFNLGNSMGWYGYAKAASEMGRSAIPRDEFGNPTTNEGKGFDTLFTPTHELASNQFKQGNTIGGLSTLTGVGKGAAVVTDFLGKSNETSGFFGKVNKQLGRYPMGGMNMTPNAEVEKQENTLNPDGSSTQFDGPSHEMGGIPTNLDPGTMIFSDKLKYNGKTFAQLNKSNNTNKENKILTDPNASSTLKQTAQLMKDTKIKNSLSLFQIQEELKQSKLDRYTKRLGGIQKFPNGGQMNPSQWDQYNLSRGYMVSPNSYSNNYKGYKEYYNPNEYKPTITKDSVSWSKINDPEWKYTDQTSPFITYTPPSPQPTVQKPVVLPTSNRQAFDFRGNMTGYKYNDGSTKYFDKKGNEVQLDTFRPGGVFDGIPYANSGRFDFNGDYNDPMYGNNGNMTSIPFSQYNSQDLELKGNPQIKQVPDYEPENQSVNNQNNNERPNWFQRNKDGLYQAGFALAQNAGQLAYLKDQGKKYDKQSYYDYSPNTVDPSAAIRDANMEGKLAEKGIRDASGGNAGSYLSNRVGLTSKIVQAKDAIRQQYANTNAQILNQAKQYNIANKMTVDDINARNKGQALNQYYKAIGSIGVNTAQGLKDNKMSKQDLEIAKMYPELYNNPQFKKFMEDYFLNK